MKKDKVNKRKMNTYLKYGLIMLAAMIFGGFLGGGMSYLNHGAPLGQTIQDAPQTLDLRNRERMFFILLILFVACIIWNEWALHQMKAIEQRLEGVEEEDENDRLEYDLDRIYSITNIVHNIFMILDILKLSTSYSAHYIDTVEDWQAYFWLAGMVVFVITFLYIGIGQIRVIKRIQRIYPQKKGDPASRKFARQWLESCNEAEKEAIYQGSYKAYMCIIRLLPILTALAMVFQMIWNTGIMAIVMLAIVWMVVSITYCKGCMMKKGEKLR